MSFKKFINSYIRFVQKILITILLTLLYFFGFGLTYLYMIFFKRDVVFSKFKVKESYWKEAKDYDANIENSLNQS